MLKRLLVFNLIISVMQILGRSLVWAALRSPWDDCYFPNVKLVDEDSKAAHLYNDLIKNKVVAINFYLYPLWRFLSGRDYQFTASAKITG